jgi:hypothetical protein
LYMDSITPEKRKRRHLKKADDKFEKLYFIHHMHHFGSGKNIEHELHHCFLFERKNMAGKKYSVIHETVKNKLFHCVDDDFEGKLYDHSNNAFIVAKKKINGKRISAIKI